MRNGTRNGTTHDRPEPSAPGTTLTPSTPRRHLMSAAARPADLVEALVERSQNQGPLAPDDLRAAFDDAGIGPDDARVVLRRLSEAGAVLGPETTPTRTRRTTKGAARPVKRAVGPQETRPAGRTVTTRATEETPMPTARTAPTKAAAKSATKSAAATSEPVLDKAAAKAAASTAKAEAEAAAAL